MTLPLGRLSPSSSPVLSADVIGSSVLHYTDGETDITLSLSSVAVGKYDVYYVGSGSAGSLALAPFGSWIVLGGARVNGGTLLGSPYLGAVNVRVAGLITCHVGYGQNRAWDVWNATNQVPLVLKAGGASTVRVIAPPGPITNLLNWSPLDTNNNLTFFAGLPVAANFSVHQAISTLTPPGGSGWGYSSPGYGSLSLPCGFNAAFGIDMGVVQPGNGLARGAGQLASYDAPAACGDVLVTQLIWARSISSTAYLTQVSFYGLTEGDQVMTGRWMG